MSREPLSSPGLLTNEELLARVKYLAQTEREAIVTLVAHLAELDGRQLYLSEGCSSLFTYCTEVLHLAEHAAYFRIKAARASRKFPIVLERLSDGSVNLSTVRLLAPHFTNENHRELLDAARHRSKRFVEEMVATLHPLPSVPASVRKLPDGPGVTLLKPAAAPSDGRTNCSAQASGASVQVTFPGGVRGVVIVEDPSTSPDMPRSDDVEGQSQPSVKCAPFVSTGAHLPVVAPLGHERYRVQFTAGPEMHAKLRLAQDLLRHQIPDGDPAAVLDRALTVLIEGLTKRKVGKMRHNADAERPCPSKDASKSETPVVNQSRSDPAPASRTPEPRASLSRHIPTAVRRVVWHRDGARCAFIGRDGRRCSEQARLEFHHVVPYARGGRATPANIELRCRAHNEYESEIVFGPRQPALARERLVEYRTPLILLNGSRGLLSRAGESRRRGSP